MNSASAAAHGAEFANEDNNQGRTPKGFLAAIFEENP